MYQNPPHPRLGAGASMLWRIGNGSFKDDMQRFFTKLMQKSFLAAYCNINLSV